jgi:hypothetical protein
MDACTPLAPQINQQNNNLVVDSRESFFINNEVINNSFRSSSETNSSRIVSSNDASMSQYRINNSVYTRSDSLITSLKSEILEGAALKKENIKKIERNRSFERLETCTNLNFQSEDTENINFSSNSNDSDIFSMTLNQSKPGDFKTFIYTPPQVYSNVNNQLI